MKFSLAAIAYVFALLAAGLAAFGPLLGSVASALVFAFWAWVASGKATVVEVLITLLIAGVLIGLLIPAQMAAHERHRISVCRSNLRSIADAVVRYREDFGRLPHAVVRSDPQTPTMCWRTAILRYLEEPTILERYVDEESWDGPTNSLVTSARLWIYCCPSDPQPVGAAPTSYFAVVDSRTVWGGGATASNVNDDPDQTLMLIEAAGMNISWAEPRDLTFAQAMALLTGGKYPQVVHVYSGMRGFFYKHHGETGEGVHVAFASGRVAFLPLPISTELATALLTANGGEKIEGRLHDPTVPQIDYGKIYAFAAFVALALLPGVRLVRKARRGESSPAAR